MKQTFIQKFQATSFAPVTREMLAEALERIAEQLRQPVSRDPGNGWPLAWNQRFNLQGSCWMNEIPERGQVSLTFNSHETNPL